MRGSEHTRVQREGKIRDLGVCQVCGSPIKPEGHHIIDYQYSGRASTDNIITLCHNCHVKVHGGKFDLLKF